MNFDKQQDLADIVVQQSKFNEKEVGLTHPEVNSFIKISDDGDVEIFAGEGIGIILHPHNKSITFVADTVRFVVRENGVKINDSAINEKARTFTEQVIIPDKFAPTNPTMHNYSGSYIDDQYDYLKPDQAFDKETGKFIELEDFKTKYKRDPEWNGAYYA